MHHQFPDSARGGIDRPNTSQENRPKVWRVYVRKMGMEERMWTW